VRYKKSTGVMPVKNQVKIKVRYITKICRMFKKCKKNILAWGLRGKIKQTSTSALRGCVLRIEPKT
jgi:hypothetical protein